MKRSPQVELAHKALQDCDKGFADYIFLNVNLTLLEKEIVKKSEIDGLDLETICMSLENWKNGNGKKPDCGYSNCHRIKRTGMLKIGEYLKNTRNV